VFTIYSLGLFSVFLKVVRLGVEYLFLALTFLLLSKVFLDFLILFNKTKSPWRSYNFVTALV